MLPMSGARPCDNEVSPSPTMPVPAPTSIAERSVLPPGIAPSAPLMATPRGSKLPVAMPMAADVPDADEDADTDRLTTGNEAEPDADGGDADHGQRAPRVVLDGLPRLAEAALLLLLADGVVLLDRHGPQPDGSRKLTGSRNP